MNLTRTIEVADIDLDVFYDYMPYEPASWDNPACGGEVEITEVMHRGEDIMILLADSVLERIQSKLDEVDHEGERYENAMVARAEAHASMMEDRMLEEM